MSGGDMSDAVMNDQVISCTDLYKSYAEGDLKVDVLRGIDLEVSRGESIAIMGSSGSGKSTALNLLEDEGYYCIDNLPVALIPEVMSHLQSSNALEHNRHDRNWCARRRGKVDNAGHLDVCRQAAD